MKTLKTNPFKAVTILCFVLLLTSCSSDDDSSNEDMPTTLELLTSSTWYLESKTPNDFTDCEKNSSFKFNTNNTITVESFTEDNNNCQSDSVISTTYNLSGNTLNIDFGGDSITATINSISETTLSITDGEGDTVVFDKTQG